MTDSNKRYEFSDFAVRPPFGPEWLVEQSDPRTTEPHIRFYKNFPVAHFPATHSFYVAAQSGAVTNTFADPNDLLAFAQQWCDRTNSARHKLLETRCQAQPRFGNFCVRFHIKGLDYGAHVGGAVLTMTMEGYMFVHPQATNRMVLVFYSERGRADELEPALQTDGEKFIDAFELSPSKEERYKRR